VAILGNALYMLSLTVGLIVQGATGVTILSSILYYIVCSLSIAALIEKKDELKKLTIAANVIWILFGFLIIFTNEEDQARIGALMLIMVASITVVALSISRSESWLSLYLDRKRAEEKKKIDELRR